MLWKYHYSLLDYYSIFKARASVSFSKHSLTKYKDVGWQKGKKDKQQIKFTIYEFIESQFVIFDPHLFLSSLVAVDNSFRNPVDRAIVTTGGVRGLYNVAVQQNNIYPA